MSRIWIVDDERAICWALKKAFESQLHEVSVFSNAEEALIHLQGKSFPQAIMLDVRLPGMDGFAAAKAIKKAAPQVPIVMMTAFGDLSTAVQAMQLDVFEYLTKPFDLPDAMRAIESAIASTHLTSSHDQVAKKLDDEIMLGSSPAMQEVFKRVAIAARSDVSVLICGEPGTGKETVASAIHRNSSRSDRPFVPFSPSAYHPTTVDSELLGLHVIDKSQKGIARTGIFELVGDGTVYIDELADLPMHVQVQLLRILDHKQYTKVGSLDSKECRARIIASSIRDMDQCVADGDLRSDLVQRLRLFAIEIPSLAERRNDIEVIAAAIVAKLKTNEQQLLASESIDWLREQKWPGNVRELQLAVEHAIVLSRGHAIRPEHFPKPRSNKASSNDSMSLESLLGQHAEKWIRDQKALMDQSIATQTHAVSESEVFGTIYDDYLSVVEPPMLRAMIESCNGNKAAAAQMLGLHRSTLRQKMRRYGIDS